jgi:hypothetical protein
VLTACTDPHPPYRRHAALALQNGPEWLVDQLAVRDSLASLRFDPEVSVRLAAAWSATLHPLTRLASGDGRSLATRLAHWLFRKAG